MQQRTPKMGPLSASEDAAARLSGFSPISRSALVPYLFINALTISIGCVLLYQCQIQMVVSILTNFLTHCQRIKSFIFFFIPASVQIRLSSDPLVEKSTAILSQQTPNMEYGTHVLDTTVINKERDQPTLVNKLHCRLKRSKLHHRIWTELWECIREREL
jgi:hypothetical protein